MLLEIVTVLLLVTVDGKKKITDEPITVQLDKRSEQIIKFGRQAAVLHGQGDNEGANKALEKAGKAFQRAVELDGSDPQAYMTYAVLMANTNQFEESTKQFKKAASLLPENHDAQRTIAQRIQFNEYGYYSMHRDKVYLQGMGNITESIELALKQKSIFNSPEVNHELATMYVMASSTKAEYSATAEQFFRESQKVAFEGFIRGRELQNQKQYNRDGSHIMTQWRTMFCPRSMVFPPEGNGDAYIAHLGRAEISGPDGVMITQEYEENVHIWLSSAAQYINLAKNLQMLTYWGQEMKWLDYWAVERGPSPLHGSIPDASRVSVSEPMISVVQYASDSFYHFLYEVLPRTLIAVEWLLAEEGRKILLPETKFWKLFEEYIPAPYFLKHEGIVWYKGYPGATDVCIKAEDLYYVNWDPTGDAVHCVPPPSLLLNLQRFLRDEDAYAGTILVLSRKHEKMRNLVEEDELVERLKREFEVPEIANVLVFDSNNETDPILAAQGVFQSAAVVIGVHGGALSNIIFCPPTVSIIELGWDIPQANHFQHAAESFSYNYVLLPVSPDPFHRGMGAPTVSVDVDLVLETVKAKYDDTMKRETDRLKVLGFETMENSRSQKEEDAKTRLAEAREVAQEEEFHAEEGATGGEGEEVFSYSWEGADDEDMENLPPPEELLKRWQEEEARKQQDEPKDEL